MAATSRFLYIALGLLMVDSIIELSFISSMVAWLHSRAGGSFEVAYIGIKGTYQLSGRPLHAVVDQGHTSNGAAGTAFILIGLGGILVLFLRSRSHLWQRGWVKALYHLWLVLTILSALLTLAALIFTFVVTNRHAGQQINQPVAASVAGKSYPLDQWTPENWFSAVLELNLVYTTDVRDISSHLRIMRGWRWNLIPMFILGLAVAVLAVLDAFQRRAAMRQEKRNVLPTKEDVEDK